MPPLVLDKTLRGYWGSVNAIVFSPDGKRIASGFSNSGITVWDSITGAQKYNLRHSSSVTAIAFSPDGKQIVSGSEDLTIRIWATATGDLNKDFVAHRGTIAAIAFLQDSQWFASVSSDFTFKIWDSAISDIKAATASHSRRVMAVICSQDGKRIASTSTGFIVRIWDATTGECEKSFVRGGDDITAIVFSPDSKRIALAVDGGYIEMWEAATGRITRTLGRHGSFFGGVGISDRRKYYHWTSVPTTTITFSPDGKWILAGQRDGHSDVWDTATGDWEISIEGHVEPLRTIAFSPDGKWVAVGSQSINPTIRIWNVGASLKASRSLDESRLSRFHFYGWQEVTVPIDVNRLESSRDGQHLLTNHGPTLIRSSFTPKEEDNSELSQLYVNDDWLYYKSFPILLLRPDSEPTCYDTYNDRISVGFKNGRVLTFDIDRLLLGSALQCSRAMSKATDSEDSNDETP